ETLHEWSASRSERFPHALTALSTHDTKRSEDVRARINVLSELPSDWFEAVQRWSSLNARHREPSGAAAIDRNEEYLFYQTLIGAWPFEEPDDDGFSSFRERIRVYLGKAIHEAKVHTSWQNPSKPHDDAVDRFVAAVLDRVENSEFLADYLPFQ